jgi:hypothetical protein
MNNNRSSLEQHEHLLEEDPFEFEIEDDIVELPANTYWVKHTHTRVL